jgi:DNA-binding CsgD family transcriptional regulator
VLVLAAQGFTQEESAQRLYLSRHTVEAHLSEARERLDALNTAHAVALAIATGQLEVSA